MGKIFGIGVIGFITLVGSLSSARAADDCPVDPCAVCGKTEQWLGTASAYAPNAYLKANRGNCHVWEKPAIGAIDIQQVYGCVKGPACPAGGEAKIHLACEKDLAVESATACERMLKGRLDAQGCFAKKLTCTPVSWDRGNGISRDMFKCEAVSETCRPAIYEGQSRKTTQETFRCPANAEMVELDAPARPKQLCKWKATTDTPTVAAPGRDAGGPR